MNIRPLLSPAWGQSGLYWVMHEAYTLYMYVCMEGRNFGLKTFFFVVGKDSISPKGDGRICQTKPPEENITESVKEIHVQTLASVKHSRILV